MPGCVDWIKNRWPSPVAAYSNPNGSYATRPRPCRRGRRVRLFEAVNRRDVQVIERREDLLFALKHYRQSQAGAPRLSESNLDPIGLSG